MLLLLVRHGLTAHVGSKLSGWASGVHLSDEGRAQTERLVERLHDVQIDAIYSSPLDRAVETAQPVARDHKVRIRQREELGEVMYGELEGRSLKTIAKSKLWSKLRAWPSDVRFPGGESLRETQARAVTAIEHLRAEHPKQVVAVFSHGDWIRLSVAHYLGQHIDLYRRINVDPASVSAIQFFEYGPIVHCVNDTGDLAHFARRHR
ncbi:MAG: MSMEG_4193 family putative phosphomutase [Actinomycetota bacterium]